MRWACLREATREEDIAYSLLGIFGVNMPLLYGEGRRVAFSRLQSEILRTSFDESIFAWEFGPPIARTGLLAPDIRCFAQKRDILNIRPVPRRHYEETNRGLRLTIPISAETLASELMKKGTAKVLIPLNCAQRGCQPKEYHLISK